MKTVFMAFGGNKRWLKATVIALALIITAAVSLAAYKAIAKVNDIVLTEADLNEAINEIIPTAVFHGRLSPEKRASFIPKALDLMIEKELLYQEAKIMGMKVDKKRFNEAKDRVIEKLGGKAKFKEALKRWNLTEKDYDWKLERKLLIDDIREREIEQKAAVSPEEIDAYYERNKASFFRPEARRIRHILIKVEPDATAEDRQQKRARAEEVLLKARAGEDMAKLAWDYSDDLYRVKGGDFGLLHKGRLDPKLDEVAFSLGLGEISDVVETIYGYHIIRVEETREPEQLSIEDVSKKIERELGEKKLKERKEAFIGGLKAKAKIEIYEQ